MSSPPETSPSFNLEETVSIITSFYEFIVRMHAGEDIESLEYPPPGGWPSIPYDEFRKMGYNDTAITLMRQLPYFGLAGNYTQIMEDTWPYDWNGHIGQSNLNHPPIPPTNGRIQLTRCEEHGFNVYCDTDRGVIIWTKNNGHFPASAPGGEFAGNDYVDENMDLDDWENFEWKDVRVFHIRSFFDMCKEQFEMLTWIPNMQDEDHGTVITRNDFKWDLNEDDRIRNETLRKAGWPGDQWDKEMAIKMCNEGLAQLDREIAIRVQVRDLKNLTLV